jgi:hypothetical protein
MTHHTRTIFLRCPVCGTEIAVECSGTADIPANISGPPESCYPPEDGEFEIVSINRDAICAGHEVDEEKVREKFQEMLAQDRYHDD